MSFYLKGDLLLRILINISSQYDRTKQEEIRIKAMRERRQSDNFTLSSSFALRQIDNISVLNDESPTTADYLEDMSNNTALSQNFTSEHC